LGLGLGLAWFRDGLGGLGWKFVEVADEHGDEGFGAAGLVHFGFGGEDAQVGVGVDLFDNFGCRGGAALVACSYLRFGEVEAGDL
jgi:hypothetical protein